jgi:acetyl-CoA C-acetyltransferase
MGAGDEEWEGFQGATFPSLYALMAKAHMHEFGTTREQLAMVSVKNHKHGTLNPKAQYRREISVEDVLHSTPVAPPLNLLDCSPISDGAASIILCEEKLAKKFTDTPIYLIGSGQGSDSLSLAQRESLTSIKAARVAAEAALKQAKISIKEVNVTEVHDCFSIAELMAMEDLGLCRKGEAGKCVERNETYFDSKMPINTSGGLKSVGHPVGATGVKQTIEIVMQLRNEADKRQVKKAEIGLTHNVGGTGGTVVVNIFRRG